MYIAQVSSTDSLSRISKRQRNFLRIGCAFLCGGGTIPADLRVLCVYVVCRVRVLCVVCCLSCVVCCLSCVVCCLSCVVCVVYCVLCCVCVVCRVLYIICCYILYVVCLFVVCVFERAASCLHKKKWPNPKAITKIYLLESSCLIYCKYVNISLPTSDLSRRKFRKQIFLLVRWM